VYENIKGLPAKEQQDFIWDKIIYANPTKPKETLLALDQYKPLVTYDNLNELKKIRQFAPQAGVGLIQGGTYVCIEGPQFSTKAESEVNRKLGFSIVGMTAIPEAKLAREAEICYTTVALVTDYDVWKEGEEVSVEAIIETLKANTANVKKLIKNIVWTLADYPGNCACRSALKFAIMTKIDKQNKKTYEKLKLLIGKYV